ncbi:putative bifunctional diguanylate cyclase/phosphodiesterase [Stutzerimonas tarimensis]|uniref:Bifunctional diguanylate cyclase/phosphodiesterase n=1 Tax=Stutzerimonas tarimensis TaxID=1507735 RepID=A0ABV7T7L6_9GAMM
MTRPAADTFLDRYLARHLPRRRPVEGSWLSLLCLLVGALLCLASGTSTALLPLWVFALALAAGQYAWPMLLGGLILGAAAVPWVMAHGLLPIPEAEHLALTFLAGVAGFGTGGMLRLGQRLREVKVEASLLRQHAKAWTAAPGSRSENLGLDGIRHASCEAGRDLDAIAGHWLDTWQGESAVPAQRALDQARRGQWSRFSGDCGSPSGPPRRREVLLVPVFGAGERVESLLALSRDTSGPGERADGALSELAELLDHLDEALVSLDPQGRIVALNACAERLFGQRQPQLHQQSLWNLCPDMIGSACFEAVRQVLEDRQPRRIQARLDSLSGWFRVAIHPRHEGVSLAFSDISDQVTALQRSQASEARLREIVELLPHVFWVFDLAEQRLTYVSPAFEKIWGLAPEHLYQELGAWLALVHPDDRLAAQGFYKQVLSGCEQAEIEYRSQGASGETLWIRNRAFALKDGERPSGRIVGIAENVTEALSYRDRLHTLSYYDPLSGLPNRRQFARHLELACVQAKRDEHELLVLVITVERIRWIQQCLGPSAKDDLIVQLTQRFTSALGPHGYLARIGSELFGVLLSSDEERGLAQSLIEELLQSLNARFRLQGESIKLSACIGVARFPGDGENAEVLVKNAIATAFALQHAGGGGFQFSHPDQMQQNLDALKLEGELERAVEQGEFVLFYQPKLGLAEQRLCGAEALIRWQHPEHGLVSPLRFVHLLEDSGLIVPAGMWCIDQALAQLATWRRQGVGSFVVAVNVSIRQLQPELVDHVRASLTRHGIEPDSLTLELTESIMHQVNGATATVNALKAMGVRIAVDDFGTGYATLGSLRSFVPDIVKVDKSFLEGMMTDAADLAIVRSVIDMAHALNMTVVAEGVECEEQKAMLEQLNCDQIQGYLLSPPLPPQAFAERFLDRTPTPG